MDKKNKEDLVVSGHRAFASWNPIFSLDSPLRVRMKAVEELTFNVTMNDFPEQQKLGEALDGLVRKCEGLRNLNYCCASEQASSSGVSSLPVTPPLNTINKPSDRSDENIDRANQDTNAIKNDSDGENSCSGEYPMRMVHGGVEMVIIGNNDTRIPAKLFDTILWNSAASAARQLLGFIFSDDELATHTLTGKPSPAFHGRERPSKSQLDPSKVADVISIVQAKCSCNERVVRAAITTKCSDTARKYKRQSKKDQTI